MSKSRLDKTNANTIKWLSLSLRSPQSTDVLRCSTVKGSKQLSLGSRLVRVVETRSRLLLPVITTVIAPFCDSDSFVTRWKAPTFSLSKCGATLDGHTSLTRWKAPTLTGVLIRPWSDQEGNKLMFVSQWREFPSAPCLARKKKLDDSSRPHVVEIARVPWRASELVSFLVGLRTYQHPGSFSNCGATPDGHVWLTSLIGV